MSFSYRFREEDDKAIENAIIDYIVHCKLSNGTDPRENTLRSLGKAMGSQSISIERIITESEDILKRIKGSDVENFAKSGDVNQSFSAISSMREHILFRSEIENIVTNPSEQEYDSNIRIKRHKLTPSEFFDKALTKVVEIILLTFAVIIGISLRGC